MLRNNLFETFEEENAKIFIQVHQTNKSFSFIVSFSLFFGDFFTVDGQNK